MCTAKKTASVVFVSLSLLCISILVDSSDFSPLSGPVAGIDFERIIFHGEYQLTKNGTFTVNFYNGAGSTITFHSINATSSLDDQPCSLDAFPEKVKPGSGFSISIHDCVNMSDTAQRIQYKFSYDTLHESNQTSGGWIEFTPTKAVDGATNDTLFYPCDLAKPLLLVSIILGFFLIAKKNGEKFKVWIILWFVLFIASLILLCMCSVGTF